MFILDKLLKRCLHQSRVFTASRHGGPRALEVAGGVGECAGAFLRSRPFAAVVRRGPAQSADGESDRAQLRAILTESVWGGLSPTD